MTTSSQQAEGIAENVWVRLAARTAMVVTPFLLGILGFLAIQGYYSFARIEKAQVAQDTHMQIIDVTANNDRTATRILAEEIQKRIDKDLLFRDLRLDGLDRRVGSIEGRINGSPIH